jgi:hypothetical protein
MPDQQRRKRMVAAARESRPEAGVYRVVNQRTGRAVVGSTSNLAGFQNRFDFARSTNQPGALDQRLKADLARFGFGAFIVEIVDTLEIGAAMTPAQINADLNALEGLWRDQQDPAQLY